MDELQQNQNQEPLSQKLLDTALKKVRRAIEGNGIDTELVKIKSYDGFVHLFTTKTCLKLSPVIAKRTEPGKNTIAIPLTNELDINNKAATRIHNAVTNQATREAIIKTYTHKDPTKGFAAKNTRMPLETLKQDYVLHQDCQTCHKTGRIACQRCASKGQISCDQCHGQRKTICHHCHGQRFIQNGNQRNTCTFCNGQGKTSCQTCHGQGVISCANCKAHGHIPCTKCAKTGVFSIIHHMDAEALSSFTCDTIKDLPQDIAVYLKDEKTRRNFTEHAKVTPITNSQNDFSNQTTADATTIATEHGAHQAGQQENIIAVPYAVKCPYATLTFEINGQEYEGKMLGYRPIFLDFPNFIEDFAKNGIESLKNAAKNRNNAHNSLKNAAKLTLIKESLSLTLRNSNMRALRQIKRIYPIGVSDKQIKNIILNTRRAIKNITFIPRLIALGIGSILALGIYYGYMSLGGDNYIIPQPLWQKQPLAAYSISTAAQLSPMIICFMLATLLARFKTRISLQKILPAQDLNSIKTNLGHIGAAIPLIYITGAALICEFLVKAENLPAWYTLTRQALLG